jgi:enamine deaminase RidA (YjgF/YER057c/UK114 family)
MVIREGSRPASAEQRLQELGIKLPAPPEPFGAYVEAVQTGNLLFLSGMLPTEGHGAKFIGRVGAEIDVEAGCKAAHLAALNVLAVARQHLESLDKVTRIVRLGVSVATSGDVRAQPKVLTPLRSCYKTSSEETRVLAAWFMASQAFRSARPSSWKSFSRCGRKRAASNVRRLASSNKCFSTIAENSKEDLWQQESQ